jgi:hypothetical protein
MATIYDFPRPYVFFPACVRLFGFILAPLAQPLALVFGLILAPLAQPLRCVCRYSGARLQFSCTGCGKCCSQPGPVYLNRSELAAIAAETGHELDYFEQKFTTLTKAGEADELNPHGTARLTLKERAVDGGCVRSRPTQPSLSCATNSV